MNKEQKYANKGFRDALRYVEIVEGIRQVARQLTDMWKCDFSTKRVRVSVEDYLSIAKSNYAKAKKIEWRYARTNFGNISAVHVANLERAVREFGEAHKSACEYLVFERGVRTK